MKRKQGFIVAELVMASVLFATAGMGIYFTLIQSIKTARNVHDRFETERPFRLFETTLKKDLEHIAILREHPFEGKKDEMIFPILSSYDDATGIQKRIEIVKYELNDGNLTRTVLTAGEDGFENKISEKKLLRDAGDGEFTFFYRDENDETVERNFWLDEPYYGLPKKMGFKKAIQDEDAPGQTSSAFFTIPQGRYGRIMSGEN